MTIPAGDLTIIVRECGERTAHACVRLLAEAFPDTTIHRVSARPFHATLRQSLELGLAEGRPWTLCIDADVLILPEIGHFLAEAVALPADIFEAQALIQDKLIPCRRPAGNHLYRTHLIPEALPLIPTADSLRPEYDMIQAMLAKGHRFHQSLLLVGLHDFEQSLPDLYMKAFLHGHKHRYLMHLFRPVWEELSRTDDDYRVALAALEDALRHEKLPPVSRDFREQEAQQAVARLGLGEQSPLNVIDVMEVQRLLGSYTSALGAEARASVRALQESIDTAMAATPARDFREQFFYVLGMAEAIAETQSLSELSCTLAEAGVRVHWISFDPVNAACPYGVPAGVEWIRLAEPGLTRLEPRSAPSQADRLADLLQYVNPPQLICWGDATFPSAFLAARITGTRLALRRTPGDGGAASWRGILNPCLGGLALLCCRRIGLPQADDPVPATTSHRQRRGGGLARVLLSLLFRAATPERYRRFRDSGRSAAESVAEVFDAAWYAGKHAPALPAERCLQHYLSLGQFLGHDPHPLFWSTWYLDRYPGTAAMNPWDHYHSAGHRLGCDPNPFFHSRWYRTHAGLGEDANPLLHYLAADSPAAPNPLFDAAWYRDTYGADTGRHATLLEDFLVAGDGRPPHPLFLKHSSLSQDGSGNPLDYKALFAADLDYRTPAARPGQAGARKRFALCTVITGDYDYPLEVRHKDADTAYFLLTDRPLESPPGWDEVIVSPSAAGSPLRDSRYLKMNLLRIIPDISGYEAIAYVDGNIQITGTLQDFFGAFLRSGRHLGLVPHPYRTSAYQEAALLLLRERDTADNVARAIALLEQENFPEDADLYEMNFFLARPTAEARGFFDDWWSLFQRYGNRDQLLAPYVMWKLGLDYFPLFPPPLSLRDHPSFACHQHA